MPFPQHLECRSKRYQVSLSYMNNLKTTSLGFMGLYRRRKQGWRRKGKKEGTEGRKDNVVIAAFNSSTHCVEASR